jgi:hypothetical protein
VKLKRLLVLGPVLEALYLQLLLRDGLVARITHLSGRGTSPESRYVVETVLSK